MAKWTKNEIVSDEDLVAQALERNEVKAEMQRLSPEISLLRELLAARKASNLSQQEVAERMNTQQATISRMERQLLNGKIPTIKMLERYANAVGKRLEIHCTLV